MSDVQELKKKRDRLKKIDTLKKELPFKYGFNLYPWQEKFWHSENKFQFIFKANQIGGSTVMQNRLIDFCTEPKLWTRYLKIPRMVIYLYPDKNTATREWISKISHNMPQGSMKDHEQYGWKDVWDGKYIDSIEFKSGITWFFKTYGSGAENLQASTPAILACDEELPEDLWPELQMRIAAPTSKGSQFWMGCTPTKGQKYLAKIQSGETNIPDSMVMTISQYDCLYYSDGSKSLWTKEAIQRIEQTLPSQREIDVRVHGLFKPIDLLAITQFRRERHVKPWHFIKGWEIYVGIDYGVGGATGHPSTIVFTAVSPDYRAARTIKAWRGPYGPSSESTTPDDVIVQYLDLCKEMGIDTPTGVYYDHSAGSIGIISERSGLGFQKANKDREHGFNTINSLFKNDMLHILVNGKDDSEALVDEIESVTSDFNKKKLGDDLLDALRYSLSSVPFDYENIKITYHQEVAKPVRSNGRQEIFEDDYSMDELGDEIDEWNSHYGN